MHPTSNHTATPNGAASLLVAALEHAWQAHTSAARSLEGSAA
jgi:hypothetical protein